MITELTPVFVTTIPETKEPGKLYVSKEHGISIHLCPCGCGGQSVLSFKPMWENGWDYSEADGKVTFRPSVLNRFCGTHYYITNNKIQLL